VVIEDDGPRLLPANNEGPIDKMYLANNESTPKIKINDGSDSSGSMDTYFKKPEDVQQDIKLSPILTQVKDLNKD
jgi:hypothetical protein